MRPLRYVVLHHTEIPDPHFDLMFETSVGSALTTFRLTAWPIESEAQALRIGDHRREYLDYEGPISGERGRVSRVDGGNHDLRSDAAGMFLTTVSRAFRLTSIHENCWRIKPAE